MSIAQAFGSSEVEKYFLPTYTHAQAQSYLEGRPPRAFLIRRSATEPGTLTFVISYVKSSGNVKHHRLYYRDGLLTPQGSDESFSSISDLLYKKGFLGGGAFVQMPGQSDRESPAAAASPVHFPRNAVLPPTAAMPRGPSLPGLGASPPVAAANFRQNSFPQQPPARAHQPQFAQQQPQFAAAPNAAYGRVDQPPPPVGTEYKNLNSSYGTNYGPLGGPDPASNGSLQGFQRQPQAQPWSEQEYGLLQTAPPTGGVAQPPDNYGNVSQHLQHSDYTNIAHAAQMGAHTPYSGMPSSDPTPFQRR